MWTEKLEHFQLLHKLNLQIIFQIGNFWNFAGKEYPERSDERNTKVVYRLLGYNRNRFPRENPERNTKVVCLAATGNDSPERKPDRIDERNTKVVYRLLGHNRKRLPGENTRKNRWEIIQTVQKSVIGCIKNLINVV
jgi:hypothetical protein